MPTLAQLGVEIDPTAAKTGGGQVEDVLGRIAAAADKMAQAVDRFADITQQSSQQSSKALQTVEKAADQTTGALKESGQAAQQAGQQTAAAATTAAAAETRATEAVQKHVAVLKEAGAAAESAAAMATTGASEVAAAENRVVQAIEQGSQAQRAAGTVASESMESIARSAQVQASMTLEAEQAARSLNTAWTQVAENHWTQETENGLISIIDTSQALTSITKEQAEAEFSLMQAVRSREGASTEANQAYAQQMQQAAQAAMAVQEAEEATARTKATTARTPAPAAAGGDAAAQKTLADQAKQQAAAMKNAREEAAKLQAGFGEVSGVAAFGQALQRNSNLLYTFASLMGPAESLVLRIANGFGIAAVAAEKMGNSSSDQSARVKDVAAANELLAAKQTALTAAQEANTAAQQAATAAQAEFATTAAEVEAVLEVEAAADVAAAEAANVAAIAQQEYSAVMASSTATVAEREAAQKAMVAAEAESTAAAKTAAAAQTESVAALRVGTDAYETMQAAEAEATVTSGKLATAQKDVAAAQETATAAAEAGGASILGIVGAILPFLAVLGLLAAALGSVYAAWHFLSSAMSEGSQFVTLHARFSQFVGDAQAANDELEKLEELSARSGLPLPDLEAGEAHLMSFGAGLKEASDEMQNFAAISVRSGKDAIQALDTLYSSARDQGYVTMRQVMQLRTVNVDLMPQLRAQTGLTGSALQHMLSQGNISFDQLKQAIDETAKSMKSLEINTNTPEGAMNSIAEHWRQVKVEFGKPIDIALVPLLQTVDEKVKALIPDATAGGNFAGNLITAVNGAIRNGQLGDLIYEVITTGTAKGWSYVDSHWFEPLKSYLSDAFGVANFGAAFDTVTTNLGSLFEKWFADGGATLYGYLMQFLGQMQLMLSHIPGLGDLADTADLRSAAAISAPLKKDNQDYFDQQVEQANFSYTQKMAQLGISTGNVTGVFGALVKSTDLLVDKFTGIAIPKVPLNPPSTGPGAAANGLDLGATLKSAFSSNIDYKFIADTISKNPSQLEQNRIMEHNVEVLERFLALVPMSPFYGAQPGATAAAGSAPAHTDAASQAASTADAAAKAATSAAQAATAVSGVLKQDDAMRAEAAQARANDAYSQLASPGQRIPQAMLDHGISAHPDDLPGGNGDITNALFANTAAVTANTNNLQPIPAAMRDIQGVSADFGRLMNGQIDRTDENRQNWNGDAHLGSPVFGKQNIAADGLMGVAVSPEQAQDLTGVADATKALQALNGVALTATDSVTGLSTTVKAVDVGPGHNLQGQPQVELTGAANNAIGADKGGTITLSLAGANVQLQGGNSTDPHISGMPIFNKSFDTGSAALKANDALPHGTPNQGTAPIQNFSSLGLDSNTLSQMDEQIAMLTKAWQTLGFSQQEYEQRLSEIKEKAVNSLIDPSQAVDKNLSDSIDQHRLYYAQIERDQKEADDRMKTNDEGVVESFIAGVRKQANAAGTLDQEYAKLGSTITSDFAGGIANAFQEMASGSKTASQAFKDMTVSILQDISKMLIEYSILALVKQLAGLGGSPGTGSQGMEGGVEQDIPPTDATGIYAIGGAHNGGIAGSSYTFMRDVDLSHFDGATRYHDGGILPGEVPIIARDGEGVFTPEQMRNLAPVGSVTTAGGGGVQQNSFHSEIHLHTDGSGDSQTRSGSGTDGSAEIGRQIDDKIKAVLQDETRQGGIIDKWGRAANARRPR